LGRIASFLWSLSICTVRAAGGDHCKKLAERIIFAQNRAEEVGGTVALYSRREHTFGNDLKWEWIPKAQGRGVGYI